MQEIKTIGIERTAIRELSTFFSYTDFIKEKNIDAIYQFYIHFWIK